MLETMRNSVSGWTAKILLGLLILSFAVWGIGTSLTGGLTRTVISAGETEVTPSEYAFAYSQAVNRISRQIGRQLSAQEAATFGVEQGVTSQLIAGAVLDEQSRKLGLGVSDERLAQVIADDPTFQDANGQFSRATFQSILANAGIRESDYIARQMNVARRSQLVDAVVEDVETPKVFLTALGLYNGERRTVDYVSLSAPEASTIADPTTEQLSTYFDQNKARYAAPEYRSISYAEVTPQSLADPKAITDAEVKADYEARKASYTTPERRRIQQIVFADKAAAEAAKAKLDGGASFEEVAKEAGRSPADIDLGTVTKASIPAQKIADAAFALRQGEVSNVVEGVFGPVLLRVTKIEPEGVEPLAKVQDQIRKDLALSKAADAVDAAYTAYEDARGGGATFEEAANQAALTVKTVKAIDRNGNGPDGKPIDLPQKSDLLAAAFDSEPGVDALPVNVDPSGYVFYDVVNIDPAHDRKLEDVRDKVVADWKRERAGEQLEERAKSLAKEVEGGKSIADVAKEAGVQPMAANAVTRQSGASELGQAGVEAAFSGPDGSVQTAPGKSPDTRLVMKVTEVAPPADPMANVSAGERQQMAGMLESDLYQSYVTLLQNEYPVRINPGALEQAKALVR
ncbi:peptidyl-prolyl cis-trans isomerase [Jiella mangrovi]|uniref:Parvulin-like PPIase n=1 Tax=Jiella mangrovi TaxID=2821407 RepID=A0ABS4BCB1_9HYPH|nr:peptidyl-prolyl cis-trans isomerase [Jiella mangrovi]MBP0614393.1 peptidyl-prolyl cis-trans isomerase [Jiella mangrovi]